MRLILRAGNLSVAEDQMMERGHVGMLIGDRGTVIIVSPKATRQVATWVGIAYGIKTRLMRADKRPAS